MRRRFLIVDSPLTVKFCLWSRITVVIFRNRSEDASQFVTTELREVVVVMLLSKIAEFVAQLNLGGVS